MFVALIALSVAAVSPPPRDPDAISAAIAEAGKGEEIVTPADRAAIRAKCGEKDDRGSTNFRTARWFARTGAASTIPRRARWGSGFPSVPMPMFIA